MILYQTSWHRLGVSVKGNSATVIVDCVRQQTRPLSRRAADAISTSGVVLLAQQIDDDTFFRGDLQHLSLAHGPEAAYELCSQHLPDCDRPLPEDEMAPADDSQAAYRGISEDELLNRCLRLQLLLLLLLLLLLHLPTYTCLFLERDSRPGSIWSSRRTLIRCRRKTTR